MSEPPVDEPGAPLAVEERVPRLVDKESALGLAKIGFTMAPCLIVITLAIPAARVLLPESAWEPVMTALFLVALPFVGVGLWAFSAMSDAMRREREAGYTTLYSVHRELWQLHPKTGEVLRRPGEREVRRRARPPG
jgi:hypothetical protein